MAQSRYYPYGVWCKKYGMWCDDVPEVTENQNDCNGNCRECEYCEEVKSDE